MNRAMSVALALGAGAVVTVILAVAIGAVFFGDNEAAAAPAGNENILVAAGESAPLPTASPAQASPIISAPARVRMERPRMMRPPQKPDVHGLSGADRIAAVHRYRAARDRWRLAYGSPDESPERRAVRWAADLLAEPRLLSARLTAEQAEILVDLHAGIRAEAHTIGREIDSVAEPMFRERIAKGHYDERALAKGYPHPSPGIVHRHGIYPSREDPRRQVRRVVSILPGDSTRIDSLRANRLRLRQVARTELAGHVRSWKALQDSNRRK